jgi:TPR repeat protein
MSTEEEKKAELVQAQSSALSKGGVRSLAARGRAELRVKEEAEGWLKKGTEFRGRQLYEDAFRCFERGIQLDPNNPELQFMLGDSFDLGWGVPQDERKAFGWMRKSAKQGYADAQDRLAWMFSSELDGLDSIAYGVRCDVAESTRWWRKAAEQGHARAQEMLGISYREGVGVPKDFAQSAFWLRKAAEQGDRLAQCELGDLYAQGHGVPKDDEQAEIWYRKAAEQGDSDAQAALATMRKTKPDRGAT